MKTTTLSHLMELLREKEITLLLHEQFVVRKGTLFQQAAWKPRELNVVCVCTYWLCPLWVLALPTVGMLLTPREGGLGAGPWLTGLKQIRV